MNEKIIVHVCCGVCAITTFRFLEEKFEPIGFWFNPNIHPYEEYKKRLQNAGYVFQKLGRSIEWNIEYSIDKWFSLITPVAKNKHLRCERCYEIRLEKTAQFASEKGIRFFTTTMFYSVHQNLEAIEKIGNLIAEKYSLNFLPMDLRPYYQKGQEISKNWLVYRQRYCGCLFSELEREGLFNEDIKKR
ncbi:MAG TPA: epoxyqueuosine reductase QueH [Candidatus Ratteibacteria bacterium]|nr:epoxyqueuosine reductase QueH [bacterium]HPC29817.1 epoxyqueuosine reductase QueH [bacterium]HRS06652.1 epoxyqueuosine reductase QueH [Candidatus Ratteibacteria bacterium]HRV05065.1 epoxyqueuosine reductase QueH [Candidatus Ratteibacteria bacterium]